MATKPSKPKPKKKPPQTSTFPARPRFWDHVVVKRGA